MQLFKSFFEGNEESILKRCNKIIEIAEEANRELEGAVKAQDISAIKNLEKESDNVAFEIAGSVTSGAVAPNLIDDILQLIDKEDSIVDAIYNLARELLRYQAKESEARKRLEKALKEMSGLADSALALLHKMLEGDKLEQIKGLRKEIERLEEKGDEIKDSLFDFAYTSKIGFRTFYHIFEVAHLMDDVLDNCEDASDMYLTIISSLLT